MPSFVYKAVSQAGKPVTGVLTAENYQVALRQLDEQALYPVKLTEGVEQSALGLAGRRRVKTHHLTTFYSQLADLLTAGVPMLRSLDVLSRQSSNRHMSLVVRELREDVAGGTSLGDAMLKHPNVFSVLHASMVRAGEQGGFLEEVLARISVFSEKQDELRNKIVGSMIYPAILVIAGTGVVLLVLLTVVPKIRPYLRPETFNVMTHVVFWVQDLLSVHYAALGLSLGLLVLAALTFMRTSVGRALRARLILRAPVIGKIVTMVAICRFCRILGTMLRNGVPILKALKISKDSAGNELLAKVIEEAGESVKKGAALSAPLGESGLFPPAVVDMMAVAEESNNLEKVLLQIAETNETRTARQIDLGVRVLEPVLLVIMASLVFCILVAILLPILTMGSGVQV
ncbi:MAG: type II secretion system F family protein [Phycisphaerae bacterium]